MAHSVRCALGLLVAAALLGPLAGCQAVVAPNEPRLSGPRTEPPVGEGVPTEKDKSTLPPYVIEPPDILFIEAIRIVPKPPYHFQANDVLSIDIDTEGLLDESGQRDNRYVVGSGGRIDLGPQFMRLLEGKSAKIAVGGMTEDEATEAIRDKLRDVLREPIVSVPLFQSSAMQPITAEHLVSPDGTVNLGTYGLVYVAGMTVDQAKAAVEEHLANSWTIRRSRCRCSPTTPRSIT